MRKEINWGRVWDLIVPMMDDDLREQVHAELAPCSEAEFLGRYCELDSGGFCDVLWDEFGIDVQSMTATDGSAYAIGYDED